MTDANDPPNYDGDDDNDDAQEGFSGDGRAVGLLNYNEAELRSSPIKWLLRSLLELLQLYLTLSRYSSRFVSISIYIGIVICLLGCALPVLYYNQQSITFPTSQPDASGLYIEPPDIFIIVFILFAMVIILDNIHDDNSQSLASRIFACWRNHQRNVPINNRNLNINKRVTSHMNSNSNTTAASTSDGLNIQERISESIALKQKDRSTCTSNYNDNRLYITSHTTNHMKDQHDLVDRNENQNDTQVNQSSDIEANTNASISVKRQHTGISNNSTDTNNVRLSTFVDPHDDWERESVPIPEVADIFYNVNPLTSTESGDNTNSKFENVESIGNIVDSEPVIIDQDTDSGLIVNNSNGDCMVSSVETSSNGAQMNTQSNEIHVVNQASASQPLTSNSLSDEMVGNTQEGGDESEDNCQATPVSTNPKLSKKSRRVNSDDESFHENSA